MNINRINYEEYFLLYLDNELSASERKAVEEFVKLHPDLEEELTMLQQSQLKPDHSLVLEDKSVLFKSESNNLINLQNYESFFLLYVDNELSVEERRAVEDFVTSNPQLHQEFDLLLRTRVSPDIEVVYPDRQLLYREVATVKVVSFKIWRTIAVAAMLLLAVGIFWLNSGNDKNNNTTDPIAKRDQPAKLNNKNNQGTKEQAPATVKEVVKEDSAPSVVVGSPKTQEESNRKSIQKVPQKKAHEIIEEKNQQPLIADNNIHTTLPDDHITAATSISKVDIDVATIGSASVSNNTLIVDQAYAQQEADKKVQLTGVADGDPEQPDVQPKSKLRGLFRQVSRVVEKTTHVPAAENKKLRIGNIQIALK